MHRSTHLGITMFRPLVVSMCLLQLKHIRNSLWHAVDPGLIMANLLEPAMRTSSMARSGLMTWVCGAGFHERALAGPQHIFRDWGQLSHVSHFFLLRERPVVQSHMVRRASGARSAAG